MNKLDLKMQPEAEGYSFLIGGLAENTRRRRQQSVRVSLRNTGADRLVTLPEPLRTREYCDDRGDFRFLLSIKMERGAVREYPCLIPAKLLEWMDPASRMSLRVERLEDDGTVSAVGQMDLMAGPDGKPVRYNLKSYVECLVERRGAPELTAFLRTNAGELDEESFQRVLGRLTELAGDEMSGDIEFSLYELYHDASFSRFSEQTAGEWLYQSAQKRFPEAMRVLKEASPLFQPPKTERIDSLEVCLASAEGGNRDAQYQLYEHFLDPGHEDHDEKTAIGWLERAVENGHDEAVRKLEEYHLSSHLVDADTGRFLELLDRAAAKGSATAHLMLFDAFYTGECLRRPIHKDHRRALKCLQSAAAAGNVTACYRMWQHFEDGNDLLISEQDAVTMLQRAADSGNADAMNDLGELYVTARIVEQDGQRGIELIKKAAELGCYEAQMRVFRMELDGRYDDVLLHADAKKAYRLLLSYAEDAHNAQAGLEGRDKGNPLAQMKLWETYTDRNPVMLTRFEALDYLRRAAGSEYLPAMFQFANAHLTGVYKDIDTQEGFRLLKRGAKLGDADAQLALFEVYYTGKYHALTCPVNRERAYKWLSRSAVRNSQALYQMWMLYRDGNEMELEAPDALEMLFSAAGMRCCDALYAVAMLFAQGECVPPDLERALKYLHMAAELGHAKSMYQLYEVFMSGAFESQTVERDDALAKRMLLLSAQLSYAPACEEVCRLFEGGNPIGVDHTFVTFCREKIPSGGNADVIAVPAVTLP